MAAKKQLVKAIRRGYAGGQIREPGDTFEFEGPLGTWMEPVQGKAEKPAPVKATEDDEK